MDLLQILGSLPPYMIMVGVQFCFVPGGLHRGSVILVEPWTVWYVALLYSCLYKPGRTEDVHKLHTTECSPAQ